MNDQYNEPVPHDLVLLALDCPPTDSQITAIYQLNWYQFGNAHSYDVFVSHKELENALGEPLDDPYEVDECIENPDDLPIFRIQQNLYRFDGERFYHA